MNSSAPGQKVHPLIKSTPSSRGTCIFDGQCGICRKSVRLAVKIGARCEFVPSQSVDFGRQPTGVTAERCTREVVFVDAQHQVYGGARAVSQVFLVSKLRWVGVVIAAPAVLPVAEATYRWVARNRWRFPTREYCST